MFKAMAEYAVIFDLDGTLVETQKEGIHQLVGDTLSILNVEPVDQDMESFWYKSDRDRIIVENFGLDPGDFWAEFRKLYDLDFIKQFKRPYTDAEPTLRYLRTAKFKTGIVTGAVEKITTPTLKLLKHSFDKVVIANPVNGISLKPSPDGLLRCQLDLNARHAVYVGNAEEDILAGHDAGFKTVLVDRGEYPYTGPAPYVIINSLSQLPSVLEQIVKPRG
jgi:N-acetyl-D-muramate 6-phosphate phosphatase